MKNEIILFETEDRSITLPVQVTADTVWLNRNQLAELFGRDIKTIGKHIGNDLKEELNSQKLGNGELVRSLSLIIHHIYPGIAIVDSKMKVTESNNGFIEILGDEAKEIDEIIPGLIGASIKSLLPQELYNQVEYVLKTSEDILNKDIEYNGHLINVSIFTLIPQKSVCMIFRNLYAEEERPEEIIHRVNEVIKETLLQVQQIGFLLGEGAAKTEKQLRSIIKTISMK